MSAAVAPASWPRRDAAHLLVSSAQMAALEAQLFESGLPVEALMEKAALAVSRRLLASLRPPGGGAQPRLAGGEILVLAGPGHNGGDGLVVARELHLAGMKVRIWSPFERRRPLTQAHLRHARWLGLPLLEDAPDPAEPALWIDALFGIGQTRPPGDALTSLLLERRRLRSGGLVAIDVPTGLCADRGVLLGRAAATAAVTYCIGLLKAGLVQDPALPWVGRLERIDLGLPSPLLASLPADQPLGLGGPATAAEDRRTAPWPAADPSAGKYGRGRLLVTAGSRRYRGAVALALGGATASGCGSLRAALPEEMAGHLWMVHPHVVLTASLAADGAGGLALAGLPDDWLDRLDAVLLGPGIGSAVAPAPEFPGRGAQERRRWEQLQRFEGLAVLDADALNRLAAGEDSLTGLPPSAWLRQRRGPTWITPHQQEFSRLFPHLAETSPSEAARTAAADSGVTVLLKGAHSVIAAPDGRCWQILEACPEAARAGLGDVLAGYAAGRAAAALAAVDRRQTDSAAWLAAAALEHARAGLAALERRGAGGVTPMAVAAELGRDRGVPCSCDDLEKEHEKLLQTPT